MVVYYKKVNINEDKFLNILLLLCNAEIHQSTESQLIVYLPEHEGTKYENTIYEISFDYPDDYPFNDLTIKFIIPIDHPLF